MKSIKSLLAIAVLILIGMGIKTQLSAMNPAESQPMVTLEFYDRNEEMDKAPERTDDQKMQLEQAIAMQIPTIKNIIKDVGDLDEPILLQGTKKSLDTIVHIIKAIAHAEIKEEMKRADGAFIAQKIQPVIDAQFAGKNIEEINRIIVESHYLGTEYITNGAIRVVLQKELRRDENISLNKIIATIYPILGGIERSVSITKELLPLYKKQYILIKAGNIPELSIADYIALNGMPIITTFHDLQGPHIEKLDLSNKGLTSVEGLKQIDDIATVQWLSLNRNQLSSLPAGIFNGFDALELLDLFDNKLSSLPADIFSGLAKLQRLSLHQNQLSSLPADIFNGLAALLDLNLSFNKLSSLPADIFKGLAKLQRLFLDANQLSSLPADIFKGLAKLQLLWLNHNQLSSLPKEIFKGLTALQWLWLNHNQLSSLPKEIFKGLFSLRELNLDHNQLNMTKEQIKAANPGLLQNIDIRI